MYSPADVKIYNVKTKEIFEEKALVAFDLRTNKIMAFGNEVYDNIRNYDTKQIAVVSPFHQGMVDDYIVAEKFIQWMIERAYGKKLKNAFWNKKKIAVILSMPQGEVQLKAIFDMIYFSGASKVVMEYKSNISDKYSCDDAINYVLGKEKDITLVMEISKKNPKEYVEETIEELMEKARFWGVEKEEILAIMQQAITSNKEEGSKYYQNRE